MILLKLYSFLLIINAGMGCLEKNNIKEISMKNNQRIMYIMGYVFKQVHIYSAICHINNYH